MARQPGKGRPRRRANDDGSLYQRADGKWVAQITLGYYANGHQRYKRLVCDTQQTARQRLRQAQNDRDRGITIDGTAPPLLDYLEQWLATSVASRCEPKTVQTYTYTIGLVRGSSLAKIPISKITPQQIDTHLSALRTTGGRHGTGLSQSTVDSVRRTLRAALNKALRQEVVHRNVAALSDPVLGRKEEVQPYTEREANQILDAAIGDRLEALYTLALGLGLRVGELLGLPWRYVDLERRVIHVRQQVQVLNRGTPFIKKYTKSRSGWRTLDLTDAQVEQLQAHHDRQDQESGGRPDWNPDGLAFSSTSGTMLHPSNFAKRYRKLIGQAGVPYRKPHNLRHTAATIMFARGLALAEVSRTLGHSSIVITMDLYIHWIPTDTRRLSTVMAGFRQPAST